MKIRTTTVGISCKDGIIMASDKRATMVIIASKDIDKIYPIDDHISMTICWRCMMHKLLRWMQVECRLYKLKHSKKLPLKLQQTCSQHFSSI